jgi:hypothetical protein
MPHGLFAIGLRACHSLGVDVLPQRVQSAEATSEPGFGEFGGQSDSMPAHGGGQAMCGWQSDAFLSQEEIVDQQKGQCRCQLAAGQSVSRQASQN